MIIDADCHITPCAEGITFEELLRRMDRAGVDKAVTWLRPPYGREIDRANAYVHDAMKAHPDRILGFGWADPNLGVEKARETARRCIEQYGFYGVKLNGAQNSFFIDAPDLSLPVIEEIAQTGRLLAFHVGADAPEHTHPFRVAKIARRYPDLPILCVHMGGVGHHDLSASMIEFARECPNLHLIGSAVREIPILNAIRALGAERVSFGSDTPFALMHVRLAMYRALLEEEFTDRQRAAVLGGNIARLFGLAA
jgi:predicted TIM-barrel fold metal-dependent hydrolase